MSKARAKNVSNSQKEAMINFMMKNENLRTGKLTASFTSQDRKRKYNEMAQVLNADPLGAKKSTEQWIKCWNDKKGQARTKGAAFNKELHKTGGGKNPIELTPTDETMLGIVGIVSAVGNPEIDEGGFSALYSTDLTIEEEERELRATPSTSAEREPQETPSMSAARESATPSTSATPIFSLRDFTKNKKRAVRDRRKSLPRTEAHAEDMRRILQEQNMILNSQKEEMIKQTAAMGSIAAILEIIANKLT